MEPASVEDEARVEESVRGRDGIRLALRFCVDIFGATAFDLKLVNDDLDKRWSTEHSGEAHKNELTLAFRKSEKRGQLFWGVVGQFRWCVEA